jgi:hypothetical protein
MPTDMINTPRKRVQDRFIIHNTYQPTSTTKKDKGQTVLALINELQIQDSTSSDEEIDISSSSKSARM